MSPDSMRVAVAKAMGTPVMYALVKRGYYYRPNASGYTDRIAEAGRYTEEEAKRLAYPHGDEPVTMEELPGPDYLNDIRDALTFVEFLRGKGWIFTVQNDPGKAGYDVSFSKHPSYHYGKNKSLAKAICDAGLKAIGLWEDDAGKGGAV
jgi:hypothetical protein